MVDNAKLETIKLEIEKLKKLLGEDAESNSSLDQTIVLCMAVLDACGDLVPEADLKKIEYMITKAVERHGKSS